MSNSSYYAMLVGIVSVLDFSHYNRCVVISNCCFTLHFPNEKGCWVLFSYAYLLSLHLLWGDVCSEILAIFKLSWLF